MRCRLTATHFHNIASPSPGRPCCYCVSWCVRVYVCHVVTRPPCVLLVSQLGTWLGFTVMTQCVPVAFFTIVGFIQMTIWARGKHRGYIKEFKDYPTLRSSILPFIL